MHSSDSSTDSPLQRNDEETIEQPGPSGNKHTNMIELPIFCLAEQFNGPIPRGVNIADALQQLFQNRTQLFQNRTQFFKAANTSIPQAFELLPVSIKQPSFFKDLKQIKIQNFDFFCTKETKTAEVLQIIMKGTNGKDDFSAPPKLVSGVKQLEAWTKHGLWFLTRPQYSCYDPYLLPVPQLSVLFGNKYSVSSSDIDTLLKDTSYMKNYCRVVHIICSSWGFSLEHEHVKFQSAFNSLDTLGGRGWQGHSFRLRHMALSLLCFKQWNLLSKLRAIATKLNNCGHINLNEKGEGEAVYLTYNRNELIREDLTYSICGASIEELLNL